jgi:hypothetical protein
LKYAIASGGKEFRKYVSSNTFLIETVLNCFPMDTVLNCFPIETVLNTFPIGTVLNTFLIETVLNCLKKRLLKMQLTLTTATYSVCLVCVAHF